MASISIALSLHATEAGYTRHRTADLLALDQSTRQLMHSVHLMTYDQVPPGEAEAALRKAWARFGAALAGACGVPTDVARRPGICAEATAMHDLLEGEVKAFGPPNRLLIVRLSARRSFCSAGSTRRVLRTRAASMR